MQLLAASHPVLCPSRDRDKRGDDELQEAHEALKAEKQQQEPNLLMSKLIKRKMKRKIEQKGNVSRHLNGVSNHITKPD